jgi:hypothetical protein
VWSLLSRVSITSPNNAANSASFLRDLYNQLLQVQANASGVVTPFSVYTGKRYYPNMLLENLMVTTDKNTENVLSIRATCKELIMVTTQTANNPMFALQSLQNPNNAPPVDLGNMILLPGQNFSMTGGS